MSNVKSVLGDVSAYQQLPWMSRQDMDSITKFQSQRTLELLEEIGKYGDPIFSKESILDTTDMLAKIVRMYCVDRNITWEYFYARHKAYCESLGMLANQVNYDRNNCKRALLKSTMTKSFFESWCQVMGVIIADLMVHFITPEKVSCIYRLSDAERISRVTSISVNEDTDLAAV